MTKPYFEKIEGGTWENNAFQWIIIPVVFGERDTLDLKVRFVGVIARFGLFVYVFAFFLIIPTVCQRMSAPTAHFPSAELRSGVLFCLNESFRINLFPKTPSQTQKSAIIVAKSSRRSSVRTHGVPYGIWATHQNDWKCWVCVCDLPICDSVCVFTTLAHPVAIIPEELRPLLSNLSLSTDVQPIRSELSSSPSAQAEPEKSVAVVILEGSSGRQTPVTGGLLGP